MASYESLHDWNLQPTEAVALQKQLRRRVLLTPPEKPIETVAGADISFNKYSTTLYAGIVVLRLRDLSIIEEVGVEAETQFPYVPGLLSFREAPALLQVWEKLQTTPDLLMCDGQGIAHPRRLGIASHLGLFLNLPTIGCAKSLLIGDYAEPPATRGSWTPLLHHDETIGAVLRTKDKVQPVFLSPGHLIDLETAIAVTLACHGGYRLPEPTRRAHLLVNRLRRGEAHS